VLYASRWQHLYGIERRRIPATLDGDLRLHRLERPLPWPEAVWPQKDHLERYPDYPPLYHRLAARYGVRMDQIVIGAGSEDLIRTLVLLSCDPGDGFAYTWPTCAMFELYAQIFNTDDIKITTYPDQRLPVERVASIAGAWKPGATSKVKLLLLPNPGQPVETCFRLDELRVIARQCHRYDTVFAIDEAYFGFGAPTALPLIDEFDNVVVLRTMSKALGAASIRVGCAIGQDRVIKPLEAIRLSGEVSGLSMRAATRLLAHWADVVEPGVQEIIKGRDWLRDHLIAAGFLASGQWANHVLVDMRSSSEARYVRDTLRGRGIHIKGDFPAPLDRHVLITAGPVSMMETFFSAFMDCQRLGVAVA
jgi:histidinol-phosphate aminotransferase